MARVLIYSLERPSAEGGLGAVVEGLCRDLSSRGHYVLRVWPADDQPFEPPAASLVTYLALNVPALDLSRLILPVNMRQARAMHAHVVDIIQRERIEVVNIHFLDNTAAYFLAAARSVGVCGIASIQGSDVHSASATVARRVRLHLLAFLADTITLATVKMRRHFYPRGPVARRLRVINNGVPLDRWLLQPAQADRPTNSSKLKLVGVGALRTVKGFDLSVRALAHLVHDYGIHDVELTIAGEGDERDRLASLASNLGVRERVKLVGFKNQGELAQLYANSDVLLMTSRAEGGPATLIEAMAHRLYIVATDVGYAADSVKIYGYGTVVDNFDPKRIAEAVARIGLDAASMVSPNMEVLDVFSWGRTVDQYEALILACAEQREHRGR